jgi:hypothetical protein
LSHRKVAPSTPEVELVELLVLFLLVSDIGADGFLVATHKKPL